MFSAKLTAYLESLCHGLEHDAVFTGRVESSTHSTVPETTPTTIESAEILLGKRAIKDSVYMKMALFAPSDIICI